MPSSFPESLDVFTDKSDNVDMIKAADVNNLQDSVARIENTMRAAVRDDKSLLSLCHFDGNTRCYRGWEATQDGAVRFKTGKFGQSLYVEGGAENFVENPAVRSSSGGWTLTNVTGSTSCSRVTSDYPPGIGTTACIQLRAEQAGSLSGVLKTPMDGLASASNYTISFWVRQSASGSGFTGTEMKIADDGGGGASGPSYDVTSSWSRESGEFTTGASQETFVLQLHYSGSSALTGDSIFLGGFQVESGSRATSYCDGDQGTGYSWTGGQNSSRSLRNEAVVQYPVSSSSHIYLDGTQGTVGLWLSPDWGNGDGALRYFLDTTSSSSHQSMSMYKDEDNKLNFKITQPGGDYAAGVTTSAPDWEPADGWMHLACAYAFDSQQGTWSLGLFVNGQEASASSQGTASTSSSLGDFAYLGSTFDHKNHADSRLDDFFAYDRVLTPVELQKIYDSPIPIPEGILQATAGEGITSSTIGNSTAVAHGLGEIPSFVEITPQSPYVVYLSDSDDTTNENFYVKSTGASANFKWRAIR